VLSGYFVFTDPVRIAFSPPQRADEMDRSMKLSIDAFDA
jgi:hypothetical protein